MKIRFSAGLAAGLVATALLPAAAAAAPANVHVRAEGTSATVVPRTAVTTTTTPVNKDGQATHTCSGTSAAGALERATGGNWAGTWFDGLGYTVDSIRGVAPDPSSEYWALWVNYAFSSVGACGAEVQAGDDVLWVVDCFTAGCTPGRPLRISRVPAIAAPGSTAAVLVQQFSADSMTGTTADAPAAGATVTAGGRQFTTRSTGIANVTFSGAGPVSVQAAKAGYVRSAAESTCVTTGTDGLCGNVNASPPDRTAPVATIKGIRDGQRFSRRRAPRKLRGSVTDDPSGLWAVKIRLTRRVGKSCWYFSGSKERFLKRTCGKRYAFKVGERPEWSYLLPSRLRRGRYVLETYAIDNAFNHGATERVAFRVR
jgi:hypothetical protein